MERISSSSMTMMMERSYRICFMVFNSSGASSSSSSTPLTVRERLIRFIRERHLGGTRYSEIEVAFTTTLQKTGTAAAEETLITLPSSSDDPDRMHSFSVIPEKGGVIYEYKAFEHMAYESIFLEITLEELQRCRKWCERQVGKPMDTVRALLSKIWPIPPRLLSDGHPKAWWNSAFAAACLQQLGLLNHLRYYELDIDDIVTLIRQSERYLPGMCTRYQMKWVAKSSKGLVEKVFNDDDEE